MALQNAQHPCCSELFSELDLRTLPPGCSLCLARWHSASTTQGEGWAALHENEVCLMLKEKESCGKAGLEWNTWDEEAARRQHQTCPAGYPAQLLQYRWLVIAPTFSHCTNHHKPYTSKAVSSSPLPWTFTKMTWFPLPFVTNWSINRVQKANTESNPHFASTVHYKEITKMHHCYSEHCIIFCYSSY